MPLLTRQLAKLFVFREYLHLDAPRLAVGFKKSLLWPIGKWLSYSQGNLIAWLWFALLLFVIYWTWRKIKPWRKSILGSIIGLFLFLYIFPNSLLWFENDRPSKSSGHVANGTVTNAKRVPLRGKNYSTYSFPAYLVGRTYVNSKVRDVILDAYKICQSSCPATTFVLGETGFKKGNTFLPHRTHKNGLSVDFMSPLLKNKKSYRSHHIFNLWGYNFDFDNSGKNGKISLDYESIAQHLLALKQASQKQGMVIQKVIFDPALRKKLATTSCWSQIENLPYTKNRVAWRHDDHYHVDFGFPSNGRD